MARDANMQSDESIDRRSEPDDKKKNKDKSRRPPNTAFRQQRLKAWQPILTPKTVLPLFFAVGIIFAPIGGLLIWASSQVQEISIDYSDCRDLTPLSIARETFDADIRNFSSDQLADIPGDKVTAHFKTTTSTTARWGYMTEVNYAYPVQQGGRTLPRNVCVIDFTLPNDIGAPVLFYYRLTNFYQNHRRYVKSLDTDQLMGNARTLDQINKGDCSPLASGYANGDLNANPDQKPYYPCGLIANSLFNDTFASPFALNPPGGQSAEYSMVPNGTAWESDRDLYKPSAYGFADVLPPPNWAGRYEGGVYNETTFPQLEYDQGFQVWMRTAGLPTFSKLALRNDNDVMRSGTYRVLAWDSFPVREYGGTKSILISTSTVMGGRNPFLGIAYVVVGGICIVLGALFTATHLIKPRKLGDHTYLTWNTDQPSTATATGRSTRPGDSA